MKIRRSRTTTRRIGLNREGAPRPAASAHLLIDLEHLVRFERGVQLSARNTRCIQRVRLRYNQDERDRTYVSGNRLYTYFYMSNLSRREIQDPHGCTAFAAPDTNTGGKGAATGHVTGSGKRFVPTPSSFFPTYRSWPPTPHLVFHECYQRGHDEREAFSLPRQERPWELVADGFPRARGEHACAGFSGEEFRHHPLLSRERATVRASANIKES